jgi:hypothetical protein
MLVKALHADRNRLFSPMKDIVFSILNREADGEDTSGFIVGFFCNLDFWLMWDTRDYGHKLDNQSYEQLLAKPKTVQSQQA